MQQFISLSLKPRVYFLTLFACICIVTVSPAQVYTSELPILVFGIAADSVPAEDKALVTLQIAAKSDGSLNSSDGPFTHYDGYAGIENRGSSSLMFPKRGYAVELRTSANDDIDFALLGMPEEEDWVLHGPYSDKSLLRNAFAYNLAQTTSTWAPRSRFCVVVFENDYRGVYLLTERIKRDKNRLDMADLNEEDIDGLQLTGGYLLKVDKVTAEDPSIEYDFRLPLVDAQHNVSTHLIYHDPKPESIADEQKDYIKAWMEEFEARLAGRDFSNEQFGYRSYIDFDSWIDFFFINEITRNVDGYRLSTFMHKRRDDRGGKLHMGPVWDFNLALGNADYCDGSNITGWAYEFNDVCRNDPFLVPFHYQRLLQDSLFAARLVERWEDFRANEWSTDNMLSLFDSLANSVASEAQANFLRWPILGEYVWPNKYVEEDYSDGVAYTRQWLIDRLEWLDNNIPFFAPDIDEPFYFGPSSMAGVLDLRGFQKIDYPISVELFSTSGQRVYEGLITDKNQLIEFNARGLILYRINTARRTQQTGKLFLY